MYLEWAYQSYNVAFTAFPILLYAVVDRDFPEQYLSTHPELYARTQKGKLFNAKVFTSWILDSLMESCVLALVPFVCYAWVTSGDSTGQSFGIWSYGIVTFTSMIFAANLRLAFITVLLFCYFVFICIY